MGSVAGVRHRRYRCDRRRCSTGADGDAVVNLATAIPPLTRFMSVKAHRDNDRVRTEGSAAVVDAALAAGVGRLVQDVRRPPGMLLGLAHRKPASSSSVVAVAGMDTVQARAASSALVMATRCTWRPP